MSYVFIKRSRIILGLSAIAFIAIYFITNENAFMFLGIITGVSVVWLGGILIDMRTEDEREYKALIDDINDGFNAHEELSETYCRN